VAFGVSARTGEVSDTVLGATGAAGPPRAGAAPAGRRRSPRLGTLVAVLAVSLLVAGVVRVSLASLATVTSASMSPALEPGDRALVWKPGPVRRGDVVVVRDQGWARFSGDGPDRRPGDAPADAAALVKRVVALPGERVRCCDSGGFLTVDGVRLDEPYLPPGTAASDVAFDVEVPPESLWLLGDARQASRDSRAGLGLPGGGAVPTRDVVGRVVAVMWPLQRAAAVPRAVPTQESP
jgi:signal peptidase I